MTPDSDQLSEGGRGVRLMILGAILAVLAPLGGFLGGSIVGPEQQVGELGAMFTWMVAGLAAGGLGVGVVVLGLLRYRRAPLGR